MSQTIVTTGEQSPQAAFTSLTNTMHSLCYLADGADSGKSADAELSAVLEDGLVPMALVTSLYPLDYDLLLHQLKTSLTGPEAGTRAARFLGQRHDMMRLMEELNHCWVNPINGSWALETPVMQLSDEVWKTALKGLEKVLADVYQQPGRIHGGRYELRERAKWDAQIVSEFFVNLGAGNKFGDRCLAASGDNGVRERRSFELLERYFKSVLTSKVNAKRKKNREARRVGAA